MRRFIGLFIIGIVLVMLLVFFTNPDLLSKIWLYLIGFVGYIITLGQKGFSAVKKMFERSPKPIESIISPSPKADEPANFEIDHLQSRIRKLESDLALAQQGTVAEKTATISLLRYYDDGETTLGLMFMRTKFFCYTLEDTHRELKVKHQTRIPAGQYAINFNKNITPMTQKYRDKNSWFDFHLQLQDVPEFEGIYIHIGNNHEHTSGCILIADGVSAGMPRSILSSSKTYEQFYKKISSLLHTHENVSIAIYNEDWFGKSPIRS
ncbi:DUF5675 family protein [Echinicola pacifica]|nr:DUF5675 family protein [Echinicola pacifica]